MFGIAMESWAHEAAPYVALHFALVQTSVVCTLGSAENHEVKLIPVVV